MSDPKKITRQQLAKFIPDPRTLKAFEQMQEKANYVNDLDVLVAEANTAAGSADSKATAAASVAVSAKDMAELAALAPVRHVPEVDDIDVRQQQTKQVEYLEFSQNAPHPDRAGVIGWNPTFDTLDICHSGGVVQQVGMEQFARVLNNTGSTITNGTVVQFAGASGGAYITCAKYIANGTYPAMYMIGLATEDIVNGAQGRVATYGRVNNLNASGSLVGETWAAGDPIYASPTTAGAMTKVKPSAPNVAVPLGFVINNSATVGSVAIRPVIEQPLYYGSFSLLADASPLATNTPYAITFDTTVSSNGVSLCTPASRIVFANAGLYAVSTSYQLTSGSASVKFVWLWYRKNGVDVANSGLKVSLESASATTTPGRRRVFSMAAGDYLEIYYASDSTNVTLDYMAATAFAPACPAVVVTVEQVQQ